jgi:hypothetical protein
MPFGFHLQCEVTRERWFVGDGWDFDSYEDGQYYKSLFQHLGWKHWISIRELLAMTELAVQILDPELCERGFEVARMVGEARQDAETLRLSKHLNRPLEAAIELWLRHRDGLRWVAANTDDAEKRARIEAFLADRQAKMDALIARAQVRVLAAQAKPTLRRKARRGVDA